MKKLAIFIGALLLGISASVAQDDNDARTKLHVGIKAGANFSNVYDARGDRFTADPKFGFAGGAFLQVPIGRYLGIHPEVLFSQKGYKGSGMTDEGYSYSYYRTSDFLDVPVFIAFKPFRHLTLLGGPQYSYLLSQSDVFVNNTGVAVQEQDFKNDNIRKNILAAVFGFDINAGGFVFGGRYGFDLQNNNGDGSSTIPRYKNVWFQGTVGFRF